MLRRRRPRRALGPPRLPAPRAPGRLGVTRPGTAYPRVYWSPDRPVHRLARRHPPALQSTPWILRGASGGGSSGRLGLLEGPEAGPPGPWGITVIRSCILQSTQPVIPVWGVHGCPPPVGYPEGASRRPRRAGVLPALLIEKQAGARGNTPCWGSPAAALPSWLTRAWRGLSGPSGNTTPAPAAS